MIATVTFATGALLVLVYLVLTARVIRLRRSNQISLHDGGNKALDIAIRGHGNFSEYVPLALVMMGLAELSGAPGWSLWLAAALLVVGRLLHAFAFSGERPVMKLRVIGMVSTLFSLIWLAALAILLVTGLLGGAS